MPSRMFCLVPVAWRDAASSGVGPCVAGQPVGGLGLRAAPAGGQCRRDGDRVWLRARRAEPAGRCPATGTSTCTRRLRALWQRTVAGAGRLGAHHDGDRGSGPVWILPALQAILLLALVLANPHRIDRQSQVLRMLGLTLAALISVANAWSVVSLATGLVRGTEGENAGPLSQARSLAGRFTWSRPRLRSWQTGRESRRRLPARPVASRWSDRPGRAHDHLISHPRTDPDSTAKAAPTPRSRPVCPGRGYRLTALGRYRPSSARRSRTATSARA
jgi:hypothetical protein